MKEKKKMENVRHKSNQLERENSVISNDFVDFVVYLKFGNRHKL